MQKRFYPLMILGLLLIFLIFSSWAAYRAATRGSEIADRDYYSNGLKYNSTLIEKRAAKVLGWKLKTALLDKQLQIRLIDKRGQLVSGAKGLLSYVQQTDRSLPTLPLNETTPGTYTARIPENLHGEINFRVDFEHAGAHLYRQLLLSLGG